MKTKLILGSAVLSIVMLSGCAPANVAVDLREASTNDPSMQTRCIDFTTGDTDKVNTLLEQYDGWKVAYTSEYTTGNKATTSMVMCFERPYKG